MSTQVIASSLTGQGLSGMWAMLNLIQILHYSAMMTLFFPKIVLVIFSFLGIANAENQYFTDVYLYHIDTTPIEGRDSWDYRFENQGVDSTNILIN